MRSYPCPSDPRPGPVSSLLALLAVCVHLTPRLRRPLLFSKTLLRLASPGLGHFSSVVTLTSQYILLVLFPKQV